MPVRIAESYERLERSFPSGVLGGKMQDIGCSEMERRDKMVDVSLNLMVYRGFGAECVNFAYFTRSCRAELSKRKVDIARMVVVIYFYSRHQESVDSCIIVATNAPTTGTVCL